MLLSLSIFPIYLLLLHSVNSADFNNNKRVPQRHTRVIRTYTSNHPPIEEINDKIPVTVVYDDEEVIKIINKTESKAVVAEKASLDEALPVNHPPSRNLHPSSEVDDYKGESNIKPKARSIQIPVTATDETETRSTDSTTSRTTIKKRKRVQTVRKVKVNKSQLDGHISESGKTENKVAQKALTTSTERTHSTPSAHTPQTFHRRNGTRAPVVPIIDSESYVFSHSGTFHYSYEGGDGTKAYERGELRKFNGGSGSAVEGNFSYKGEDGNDVSLSYTADENGYRPVGAHLPTPPPIPVAIARALAYLATKTTPEPVTERIKPL